MAERSGDAAEIGRRAAEAALGTARRGGQHLGEEVRGAAAALIAEQQAQLAETVHGFALALRRTADALGHEQSAVASRCAGQAAAQLDRAATALRERSIADMLAEVEALARRQPALFIAGSVVAGFLAARLLAAPAPPRPERAGDNPWQEGPQPADETVAGAAAGRW